MNAVQPCQQRHGHVQHLAHVRGQHGHVATLQIPIRTLHTSTVFALVVRSSAGRRGLLFVLPKEPFIVVHRTRNMSKRDITVAMFLCHTVSILCGIGTIRGDLCKQCDLKAGFSDPKWDLSKKIQICRNGHLSARKRSKYFRLGTLKFNLATLLSTKFENSE
jgi:hypothetical protein